MRTPKFWYKNAGFLSSLLSPIGQLYGIVGTLRRATTIPYKATVPVICVGNIVAGGAGKTPTCLALKKLLQENNPEEKIVFVTRGYGGREQGPVRVNLDKHTFEDVGDEALLLAREAPCWVGRDRASTICEAEKEATLIILDDGLQNQTVKPDLSLLIIDGGAGLGNRHLIPAGPLRETLNGALKRIDAIIVIGADEHLVTERINKPIFHAKLIPRSRPTALLLHPEVLAFAGIGRPQKFYDSCSSIGLVIKQTCDFPDHHPYSELDLQNLKNTADRNNLALVTTTKDYVRVPKHYCSLISQLEVELIIEDASDLISLMTNKNMPI